MELTKLQRLGLSKLFEDLRKHNPFVNDGTIEFVNNPSGEFTNMYVNDRLGYKFQYTLTNENIDDNIKYQYSFDGVQNMYHIVTIEDLRKGM